VTHHRGLAAPGEQAVEAHQRQLVRRGRVEVECREGSLGWLGRWRRLAKDYEALPEVSEAMVTLAMIRLTLHRLVHPNRRRLPAP